VTEPRIGPPFNAVAIRYSQQPRAVTVEVLAAKILNGGAGNWGSFPMIARERLLSPDQARVLARAILDLRITP
jgi:cytochrome c